MTPCASLSTSCRRCLTPSASISRRSTPDVPAIRRGGGLSFDGRSFLPVLLGESDKHRESVFGLHTSRGISNGSDYPIRSVRGARSKYIRNLNHENPFTNNVTERRGERDEDDLFDSWLATKGKQLARANFYQHRPAEELYDLETDPYELHNLVGEDELADVQSTLRQKLNAWMTQQGDEGMGTEQRAYERIRKQS